MLIKFLNNFIVLSWSCFCQLVVCSPSKYGSAPRASLIEEVSSKILGIIPFPVPISKKDLFLIFILSDLKILKT